MSIVTKHRVGHVHMKWIYRLSVVAFQGLPQINELITYTASTHVPTGEVTADTSTAQLKIIMTI